MKIHEYQAKAMLATTASRCRRRSGRHPGRGGAIAERLGGRVVVKAQIHAGGRGKGGGVKLADDPAAAEAAASRSSA